jgi:anti-sigma-K factor RskA
MSQHVSDDLPRLLTGNATRDETMAAAAHLRSCPDCQQDLVAAVVAHASLSSARRFAAPVASAEGAEAQPEPMPLPDLSALFAEVREDAAKPKSANRRRALLAVAAAAVLATAGGITIAETLSDTPSGPAATTVALRSIDPSTHASAEVTVTGDRMHVDATSLPKLDAGHQYEVWLVDPADDQLRPLGYVGSDRTAELTVPAPVMAQYTSVAISLQQNNQVEFSGDLVVRGSYG